MTILSEIRSNRRELRNRGVTPTGLLILEALAYKAPGGFVRLSVAALGRMVGIGRATALRHVQKLEAIGAVIRLGPAIMVNAKGVLSWCAQACRNRAAHLKRLFHKKKSQHVCTLPTHRELLLTDSQESPETWANLHRTDATAILAATYIPHWKRKNR